MPTVQDIKKRYQLWGKCPALDRAISLALTAAKTSCSVMVLGETGSGKDVMSRIIHDFSPRRKGKYLAVNCGALPKGTIESDLFGHEKGSFTGAEDNHKGYFATCNGGTLFLDEIAELPLETQARLLRVLENGEYIPVGSNVAYKTDVRIVAATNVNLEQAVAKGKFRADLYYRINVVTINIPPLRKRGRDDIRLLFNSFSAELAEQYKREDMLMLSDAALDILAAYSWPGNVRQLRKLVENLTITELDSVVTPEMLNERLSNEQAMLVKCEDAQQREREDSAGVMACLHLIQELAKDLADLRQHLGLEPYADASPMYDVLQKTPKQHMPLSLTDKTSASAVLSGNGKYSELPGEEFAEYEDSTTE